MSVRRAPIGLFYGSSTCFTEITAEHIQSTLGPQRVDIYDIGLEPLGTASHYSHIILGIPTWDYGELQEDWENCWSQLEDINWQGKKVALYGLGDQVGYPAWFQDALGYLWARVTKLGAITVGLWPVEGYTFDDSKALTSDGQHFFGLALDEENQWELSDARIALWCRQVLREFALD